MGGYADGCAQQMQDDCVRTKKDRVRLRVSMGDCRPQIREVLRDRCHLSMYGPVQQAAGRFDLAGEWV